MTKTTPEDIRKGLAAPFTDADIEWRISHTTKDGTSALVLAYLTNRAIMDRLDATVGAANWYNAFHPWREKGVLCELSVKIGGEWITKADGADVTDIEATKGGFSAAMKRAGVMWGMGRELYSLPDLWWPHIKAYGSNEKIQYRITKQPTLADCLKGAAAPPATRTPSPRDSGRAPGSPRQEPDTERSRQGHIPIPPPCPICSGEMWDNRDDRADDKREGKPKPRPAWKCKDSGWDREARKPTGCAGKYWPADPNEAKSAKKAGPVPPRPADLEPQDDDRKPLTDADAPF